MISLSIRTSGDIAGLGVEMDRRMDAGFSTMLRELERRARMSVPVRTGSLRDSIAGYLRGRFRGSLVFGAPHASFVLEGTGIYGPRGRAFEVSAKDGKALHWPGASHPVKNATIRGVRPNDFITRAIRHALLEEAFEKGFDK